MRESQRYVASAALAEHGVPTFNLAAHQFAPCHFLRAPAAACLQIYRELMIMGFISFTIVLIEASAPQLFSTKSPVPCTCADLRQL